MEITLDALSLGKPTIIKDKQFLSTIDYTGWFIKEMLKYTKRFIVKVQMPNQITLSKDREDVTYNKVWIQAIMPHKVNDFLEVFGLAYALDVKTPIYKIYRAYLNPETLNTVVFDPSWAEYYPINSNELISCSLDNLVQKPHFAVPVNKLKNTFISDDIEDLHELLGEFIDKTMLYEYKYLGGKIKLSINNIIDAYQKTFCDLTKSINQWSFYTNICNEINDDKDITNMFEKTLLVGMLFNLVDNEHNN